MLDRLNAVAPDPILGIIAAHAADPNPKKIDLGIGVYKDEAGNTPILHSVKKAEQILDTTETSKTYLGPPGVKGFNSAITELIFGADSDIIAKGRVATIQTPGGTGGLRVGADLINAALPGCSIYVSDPTWANHNAIFPAAGLDLQTYPYFDKESSNLRFDDMVAALQQRGPVVRGSEPFLPLAPHHEPRQRSLEVIRVDDQYIAADETQPKHQVQPEAVQKTNQQQAAGHVQHHSAQGIFGCVSQRNHAAGKERVFLDRQQFQGPYGNQQAQPRHDWELSPRGAGGSCVGLSPSDDSHPRITGTRCARRLRLEIC